MHQYEIRILRADKSTDTIMEMAYLTDFAAIKAARKLAEARPFEVWRGLQCIYGRSSKTNWPDQPPPNSAA